jgi:hypothetical protein
VAQHEAAGSGAHERVEAWWHRENSDRPAVQITAPRADAASYKGPFTEDLHRHWTDPEFVIPRELHRVESTYYAGEAFPVLFPVSGRIVSILNRFLGAPNRYVNTETTWSEAIIEDWHRRPTLHFDPENEWWRIARRLLQAGRETARQRYQETGRRLYLGNPDLNGPTEVLAGLRGRESFAMDLYDNPEAISAALEEVNRAWYDAWKECTEITHELGGYFFWMRIWSELPAVDLQSDVSGLMSQEMFQAYLLPAIEEQTRWVDRTIYHLDGPDAVRHLDAILELEELDAVQWVPGAGAAPAVEWIPLLRKIQAAGKSVYTYCRPDEVAVISGELAPEGLMLVTTCETEEAARELQSGLS